MIRWFTDNRVASNLLMIAIILGGFAVMALGQPMALLLLLIALKTGMDIKLHLKQREGYRKKRAEPEQREITSESPPVG